MAERAKVRSTDEILKEAALAVRQGKPGLFSPGSALSIEFDVAYTAEMRRAAARGDHFALSLGYGGTEHPLYRQHLAVLQARADAVRANSVTRFALTFADDDGLRALALEDTYPTREAAEAAKMIWVQPRGLPRVMTPAQVATIAVRAVRCYGGLSDGPFRVFEIMNE